jgi:hypothetical protein
LSAKVENEQLLNEIESTIKKTNKDLIDKFHHSCKDFSDQRKFLDVNNKYNVLKAFVLLTRFFVSNQSARLYALATIDALLTDDKSNV